MVAKFKSLIFCLIVLEVSWLVVPMQWSYFGNELALGWLGLGGVLTAQIDYYFSYALSFLYIFMYLALYSLRRWARWGLLVVISLDIILSILNGIQVYSGFELLIAKLLCLGAGLVLGLSFTLKHKEAFSV